MDINININNVITMAHESFRNENGIMIKKCCASCKKRKLDNELGRSCSRHKVLVDSDDCCKKWVLSPKLNNAGNGIGKVKSRSYLNYYRKKWMQQIDALERGEIDGNQMKCAGEIREEYEREYGSIYVEI
jgi:hypothetical protein